MKNRVGEKFTTTEGQKLEIIEYFNCYNCTIKFEDGTILKNREYGDLKKGNVKNPFFRSVCKIGYIGGYEYVSFKNHKRSKSYQCWKNILTRCYETNDNYQPDYKDCKVAEEWHNYQNFAKWWEENYNPITMEGWHIDKDILSKGNKIYSPDKCCFVPMEINILFIKSNKTRGKYPIGVSKRGRYYTSKVSTGENGIISKTLKTPDLAFHHYKINKEKYIKEMAEKWRNLIADNVYKALINYKVEITD